MTLLALLLVWAGGCGGGSPTAPATTLDDSEPRTARALPREEPADAFTEHGVLEPGDTMLPQDRSLYDTYAYRVEAGMVMTITMTSPAFNSYLHLLDEEGNVLAQNDDSEAAPANEGTASGDARIVFTTTRAGIYTIFANGYDESDRGPYILKVVTEPSGGP